jgi:site-specific DNA recombinase
MACRIALVAWQLWRMWILRSSSSSSIWGICSPGSSWRRFSFCRFAQFERELIGERTRDKMSAARREGKWTGGSPVLGYDVHPGGGRLVVNEEEAERVRAIFALFEEHRSMLLTLIEIERRGWRLKSWTRKTGQFRAGGAFDLGSLRRLLTNILYTGSIQHRGKPYPGEHTAILAHGTWERAQSLIAHGRRGTNITLC